MYIFFIILCIIFTMNGSSVSHIDDVGNTHEIYVGRKKINMNSIKEWLTHEGFQFFTYMIEGAQDCDRKFIFFYKSHLKNVAQVNEFDRFIRGVLSDTGMFYIDISMLEEEYGAEKYCNYITVIISKILLVTSRSKREITIGYQHFSQDLAEDDLMKLKAIKTAINCKIADTGFFVTLKENNVDYHGEPPKEFSDNNKRDADTIIINNHLVNVSMFKELLEPSTYANLGFIFFQNKYFRSLICPHPSWFKKPNEASFDAFRQLYQQWVSKYSSDFFLDSYKIYALKGELEKELKEKMENDIDDNAEIKAMITLVENFLNVLSGSKFSLLKGKDRMRSVSLFITEGMQKYLLTNWCKRVMTEINEILNPYGIHCKLMLGGTFGNHFAQEPTYKEYCDFMQQHRAKEDKQPVKIILEQKKKNKEDIVTMAHSSKEMIIYEKIRAFFIRIIAFIKKKFNVKIKSIIFSYENRSDKEIFFGN